MTARTGKTIRTLGQLNKALDILAKPVKPKQRSQKQIAQNRKAMAYRQYKAVIANLQRLHREMMQLGVPDWCVSDIKWAANYLNICDHNIRLGLGFKPARKEIPLDTPPESL